MDEEIGTLYKAISKNGLAYWRGKIRDEQVVAFASNSTNPNAPAIRIYKSNQPPTVVETIRPE